MNLKVTRGDDSYIQISDLKSSINQVSEDYYRKINKKVDKKFYIGIDFLKIYNSEYPNEYFTALFNEISNKMPPVHALHNFDLIPKVCTLNEYIKN